MYMYHFGIFCVWNVHLQRYSLTFITKYTCNQGEINERNDRFRHTNFFFENCVLKAAIFLERKNPEIRQLDWTFPGLVTATMHNATIYSKIVFKSVKLFGKLSLVEHESTIWFILYSYNNRFKDWTNWIITSKRIRWFLHNEV